MRREMAVDAAVAAYMWLLDNTAQAVIRFLRFFGIETVRLRRRTIK